MIDTTNKEYLRYVRNAAHRVDNIKATKQRLLESATSITARYDADPVANSIISRRPEVYAVSVQDEEIRRWLKLISSATQAIYQMKDPKLQDVLELYYIQCLTWEQVADRMGYSYKHVVHELHARALGEYIQPDNDRM